MSGSSTRPSPVYYVAVIALVLGIGAGLALFWRLTTDEGDAVAAFTVAAAEATSCPPGTGATVCYTFDVTNSGSEQGIAACTVTAATGSAAVFANDETEAEITLEPNETRYVLVKVVATDGDVIRPPALACA